MVEIVRQLGHVDQSVDLRFVEFDEQPEAGHPADGALELAADVLLHPCGAVAIVDLAGGVIGTTRTLRALQRQRRHLAWRILERLRPRAAERVLDRAMHQQIGITPDRRGEVRVRFQREAEVADVGRVVHRQALAAQQHRFDQGRVGTLADLLQQMGEVARMHLRPRRHAQLEFLEELLQVGVLLLGRSVVDTVGRWYFGGNQKFRRLHVRRDHAFLDQLVRVVALQHAGLHHFAGVAEHEAHLAGLELDRAAALARLGQDREQLVQALDVRQQRADLRQRVVAQLLQHRIAFRRDRHHRVPDLGVGQARVRMHHRLVESGTRDFALAVDLHVADEAQAIDVGLERADPVRQRLRQHRHDETGEVHRRRAPGRFLVQRRAGAHVIRHVGDGHHQAETLAVGFAVDGVVEVPGILAVDRDQRQHADIDALRGRHRIHVDRHRRGFVEHVLGEFVRTLVAVNRRLHRQRGSQAVSQHRQHAADRRALRVRRLDDLGHHQLAVLRFHPGVRRDLDVALDAAIVRHDVADPGFKRVAADQAVEPAFQHLDDRAFATAAAVDAGDAGQHAVAVHDLAHLERRQEQVVATARFRAQETEAVRVGDHHSGNQVHARGRRELALAVLQQLAIAHHRAQSVAQRIEAVGRGEREFLRQCIGRHRAVGGRQQLQDHFAAGDGLLVAGGFAVGVGIAQVAAVGAARAAGAGRAVCARRALGGDIGQPGCAFGRRLGGRLAGLPGMAGGFAACCPGGLRGAGLAGRFAAGAGAALAGSFLHRGNGTRQPSKAGGGCSSAMPARSR